MRAYLPAESWPSNFAVGIGCSASLVWRHLCIAPVHSIQYMVQSSIALDKVKEEIKKAIWSIFPIPYPRK